MNLKIKTLSYFKKDTKKLFKKYKQLSSNLKILKQELSENLKDGVELGNSCYKIRLANNSIQTDVNIKHLTKIAYVLEVDTEGYRLKFRYLLLIRSK